MIKNFNDNKQLNDRNNPKRLKKRKFPPDVSFPSYFFYFVISYHFIWSFTFFFYPFFFLCPILKKYPINKALLNLRSSSWSIFAINYGIRSRGKDSISKITARSAPVSSLNGRKFKFRILIGSTLTRVVSCSIVLLFIKSDSEGFVTNLSYLIPTIKWAILCIINMYFLSVSGLIALMIAKINK